MIGIGLGFGILVCFVLRFERGCTAFQRWIPARAQCHRCQSWQIGDHGLLIFTLTDLSLFDVWFLGITMR